jgi:hypothetical protein
MAVSGIDESDRDMAIRIGNPEIINTPAPPSYTNANTAFTAADVIGGIIVQDGTGGVSIALPSAVNIAAAIPGTLRVGDTFSCLITNGANASGTITLTAGTGGSFDTNQGGGSRTIPFANSKYIIIRFTAVGTVPTYTIYS